MSDAGFRDAWRAALGRPDAGMVDLYFGIFGHRPSWMNGALLLRNRVAALFGLETPSDAEILGAQRQAGYRVGDKIGPWPIYLLGENELVAGRDNGHLDFRVSIMKVEDEAGAGVVVSTLCRVHNTFGRCYLFLITPFHRLGVRYLLSSALAAHRL